jgi:ABC-type iron transport system FetAB permease component
MIELGLVQIALALVFMVAAIALVRWQKLGLELSLLNATARTGVQLLAVGRELHLNRLPARIKRYCQSLRSR